MQKLIAAVGGNAQMGKDTLANYMAQILPKHMRWRRASFASKIKKVFCEAFGVDEEFVERWKTVPEPPPGFEMPVRQGLQMIGSGFRKVQADVWIRSVIRASTTPIIISDTRYINELLVVRNCGGTNILIWRPDRENEDPSDSEAQIRPILYWFRDTGLEGDVIGKLGGPPPDMPYGAGFVDLFVRNEGTVEDLFRKAREMVLPYLNAKLN